MKEFHLLVFWFSLTLSFAQVQRDKNISYLSASEQEFDKKKHQLDVYYANQQKEQQPVLIFIHGGSWDSGRKGTYAFLGKRLAKKGITTVIINYRLSPKVQIDEMILDCEQAMMWVYHHIAEYGGDPNDINVMGHSAGGHLTAMLAQGAHSEIINRVILNDAFGLDMLTYFRQYDNRYSHSLYHTFTSDPMIWPKWSPIYGLSAKEATPFLILTGEKTFETIKSSNWHFADELEKNGIYYQYIIIENKKHVPMIAQLFWSKNPVYDIILRYFEK